MIRLMTEPQPDSERRLLHAGDVLDALQEAYPRIHQLLHQSDQRRTLTLAVLHSEDPDTLGAIEAASRLLEGLNELIQRQPAELAGEFVTRITSDFIDGLDGMLEHKVSAVLDPCRDLMELSVLFREFRVLPHRFDRWREIDEVNRLRDFSFGRLLKNRKDHPISGFGNIESALAEYTQHSRTLHPAVPLTNPNELARAPGLVPPEAVLDWAHAMGSEVLRHTMIAFEQFIEWHIDRIAPVDELEIDIDPDDWAVVYNWFDRTRGEQASRIPPEFMEAIEALYRHKKRDGEPHA